MSTHGALTESSRTYHPVTPDRKGREGKGREVGHACIISTGSERDRFASPRALPFPAMRCAATRPRGRR